MTLEEIRKYLATNHVYRLKTQVYTYLFYQIANQTITFKFRLLAKNSESKKIQKWT